MQFAEEMQAIRDGKLYPNARGNGKPWDAYCRERWNMSKASVDDQIRAMPVLLRRNSLVRNEQVGVTAAAAVASLPAEVQDAILADNPKHGPAIVWWQPYAFGSVPNRR